MVEQVVEQVKPTSIMKKISFKDRYWLTSAVLEKRKTMMRRIERIDFFPGSREEQIEKFCKHGADAKGRQVWLGFDNKGNWIAQFISHYAIGEEIAVAQSYKSIVEQDPDNDYGNYYVKQFRYAPGWTNKMFVRADLMPHRIRITDIRVERLQDISDEDCMREGVYFYNCGIDTGFKVHGIRGTFCSAKRAFSSIIDRVNGEGTWERNPWVPTYTFELVR